MRDNVEWSFNIETEVLVEFTLNWFSWIFIGIDDVPLLVETLSLVGSTDVLVLIVLVLVDF